MLQPRSTESRRRVPWRCRRLRAEVVGRSVDCSTSSAAKAWSYHHACAMAQVHDGSDSGSRTLAVCNDFVEVGPGEPAALELPGCSVRESINPEHMSRNELRWQLRPHHLEQPLCEPRPGRAVFGDKRNEPAIVYNAFPARHCALGDSGAPPDHGLQFGGVDSVPADLQLVLPPAEEEEGDVPVAVDRITGGVA